MIKMRDITLLSIFLAGYGLVAGAGPITATVTAVPQGDRLTIQHDGTTEEIRLYGADCPEKGQPFSDESTQFAAEKLLNQEVKVDILTTDNLNKPVAKVTLADGADMGQALIEAGLAWCDRENAPNDRALKNLNAKAITAQVGLWKEAGALSPRDYRESNGITQFTYSVVPKPLDENLAPAPEEPKSISAKGEEVYKGGFSVNVADIKFDKEVDVSSLMTQHMPTVAMDANGNPQGLAVPNISGIPYASQLGFRDGDIISGVNGEPIRDMGQLYGMYDRLKNSKSLNVQIMRGGKPTNININIP